MTTNTIEMRFEIAVLPVADVDRAKDFYTRLGWRLDADFGDPDGFRVVQFTPPGSPASVIFGNRVTSATAGTARGHYLVVDDIEAARAALVESGAEPSEIFHDAAGVFHRADGEGRVPGPDPERRSYASFLEFADPDGNEWFVQEITTRLPGR